ncbi:MAG: hypothetical protein ALECFALPRED_010116 [Alectoria fallacina]|uniref:Uncharacterized protein n=1 Tax=Alectoria fallacina TaxID=1903189 RepID=A0A8H3F0L2_9LECA|nr:MAG: hypothetical protein ALECFALPRED_010116 [Alectoria fallacina]
MDEEDQPLYIASFDVIGLPWRPDLVAVPNPADFHTTECALRWCLQAYQITVNSTQQLQTNVETWSQRTRSGQDQLDGSPAGIEFKNIPPEFNVLPGTTCGISQWALRGIQVGFSDLFGGSIEGSWRSGFSYNGDLIQFIWSGSQDMNKFINNIAVSMTNGLRTQAPADKATHSYYAGTAYSMQTYTRVRWAWIILPAATVVGSVIFLLAIMWQSRRRAVHRWKDSALAPPFFSVPPKLMQKGKGGLDHTDEWMKKSGGREGEIVRV